MKIKFTNIRHDERFTIGKKVVKVGDIVDVRKEKADEMISRGKAEKYNEAPKKKQSEKGGHE